ncbi:MAG TPA: cytochrome C oxidase subunit IV family protein [Anaerolineae bacterium]
METQHTKPNYIGVFIALVALTTIEVIVTYLPVPRLPILIPLSVTKAVLVVMFYMHLKYDRRLFSGLFLIGVFGALAVIIAFVLLFTPPLLDVAR